MVPVMGWWRIVLSGEGGGFGCRWKLTPATLIGHELCCGGRSDEEGWSEREKGKEEEKECNPALFLRNYG